MGSNVNQSGGPDEKRKKETVDSDVFVLSQQCVGDSNV